MQVGSSAYLHCPVIHLGEKEVLLVQDVRHVTRQASFPICFQLSWVRRSDWHILSHGTRMFTQDDRFQLVPDPPLGQDDDDDYGQQKNMGRQDWTLMIKFVTARDSGAYECQVILKDV